MNNYWDSLARQFQHQGPPLRPCAEDIRIMRETIHEWSSQRPRPRINVLLFGVTPEIATLSWPAGTHLLAVEKSQAMIELIWPGDIPDQRQVSRQNWFEMNSSDHAFDIVIGDGFMTGMKYPDQYLQISRTAARWLKPDGLLIARIFARPEEKESLKDIRADLSANRIASFDALKWRLAMAIQKDIHQGVAVADVYRAWKEIEASIPGLAKQAGWPDATVATIELYNGRPDVYTFPTVKEFDRVWSAHLEQVSVTFPQYDFGTNCPILVYRPRPVA